VAEGFQALRFYAERLADRAKLIAPHRTRMQRSSGGGYEKQVEGIRTPCTEVLTQVLGECLRELAHHPVPRLADSQLRLALPGILLLRNQTQIRPDVTTLGQTLRIFQRQYVGQGGDRSYPLLPGATTLYAHTSGWPALRSLPRIP